MIGEADGQKHNRRLFRRKTGTHLPFFILRLAPAPFDADRTRLRLCKGVKLSRDMDSSREGEPVSEVAATAK